MPGFFEQIQELFKGRVCLVGVGNVEAGDDGLGVRLAEELSPKSKVQGPRSNSDTSRAGVQGPRSCVLVAGTVPERFIGRLIDAGFDHVIFLDAVEFGGAPGAVVLLNGSEMAAKFPQVSTHKFSLGLLAKCLATTGRTRAWLLGVQPESLRPAPRLTPAVQKTLNALVPLLSKADRNALQRVQAGQQEADLQAGPAVFESRARQLIPRWQPAIA